MWKRAYELQKAKRFRRCGLAFQRLAARYPKDPRLADALWNGAWCFRRAGQSRKALSMFKNIVYQTPKSRMAPRALESVAWLSRAMGRYSEAAAHYEAFADRYSKLKDAPNLLRQAIVLRWATGDHKQAIRNARAYVKRYSRYGRRHTRRIAEVHFWLHRIYEHRKDNRKLTRHLNTYLKRYGHAGGLERRIEALAKLGRLHWRRSCKTPATAGLCVRRIKKPTKRNEHRIVVRYLKRDYLAMRQARSTLAAVLRVCNSVKSCLNRHSARFPWVKRQHVTHMTRWVAMARFILADMQFERVVELQIPTKLNFDPSRPALRKRSQIRFATWAKSKAAALGRLQRGYEQVVYLRQPQWSVAAIARLGMLFQEVARQLRDGPTPSRLKTKREKAAFRAELGRYAEPLELKAKGAYAVCLVRAIRLSVANQWSRLCERRLNELDKKRFPLPSEIRPRPGYTPVSTVPGGPVGK